MSRAGKAETEVEVLPAGAQRLDVYSVPDPALAGELADMGMLGELGAQPTVFEPFSDTPGPRQMRACFRKQLVWHHELERRARAAAGDVTGEDAYAKTVTDAKNKIPGAVKVRADAKVALLKTLEPLRAIVQTEVDAHLDQAATIAESAKMKLRKVATHTKAAFAAHDGLGTGQVHLVATAIPKALLYFWEVSVDQKVWTMAFDTSSAHAVISGLTVGQTYSFRFRARTRKAMTDYSQVLSHVVR